jgi:hypothetical protein
MTTPLWTDYLFATLMLAIAGYSVLLLGMAVATRRSAGWDVDVAHALMGVSMAGMFVAGLAFGPYRMWESFFAFFLAWFLVRSAQSLHRYRPHVSHYFIHAIMSLAMLLMYALAGASMDGFPGSMSSNAMSMPMSSGPRLHPWLSFLLALTLLASAIFTLASPKWGTAHHRSHDSSYAVGGVGRARNSPNYPPPTAIGIASVLTATRLKDASHVAMCFGMGFLFIVMS